MRIAELSRRSGTPVATVKFYRRAGLLPSGNDRRQLYRLRAIRVLREIGRLPVAAIATGLRATGPAPAGPGPGWRRARALQRALLPAPAGGCSDHPAWDRVAEALRALAGTGHPDPAGALAGYLAAGRETATCDAARADPDRPGPDPAAATLLDLVLGDALLAALHRLAHEQLARESR